MNIKNQVRIKFPHIATQIIEMVRKDQEMRLAAKDNLKIDPLVDLMNLGEMKSIIEKIGWPSRSLVGKEAAKGAWLLVQHADTDVDFQEKCLEMMQDLPEEEIDKQNIAYLEDRVRCNRGQLQIYGTQFELNSTGELVPKPLYDSKNVDKRRRIMNLKPMAEYIKDLKHYLR